jgi:ceramide glucosyltransferase
MGQMSMLLALIPTLVSLALWGAMYGGFVAGMRTRKGARPYVVVRSRRAPKKSAKLVGVPRVSILKPLAGADDDLPENLRTFAALDYPNFEILFGVASIGDSAYAVAHAFLAAHPQIDAQVIVTEPDAALNPKVAQLMGLEARASGHVLVVSDSNVRVEPGYLTSLVDVLSASGCGIVSSIIRGAGERTLGAALENLQIGAYTSPGVVSSTLLAGRAITVGKSLAIRRDALAAVGGFAGFGGVLAEDHVLGRAMHEAGYSVGLCLAPVSNWNVAFSLKQTMARHLRWAKLRRSMHPTGYCFEPLVCPIAVATLSFFLYPCEGSAWIMAIAMLTQATGAVHMMKLMNRGQPRWYWGPLELGRSYVTLFCWAAAFTGGRVQWRGNTFELGRDSSIRTKTDGATGSEHAGARSARNSEGTLARA